MFVIFFDKFEFSVVDVMVKRNGIKVFLIVIKFEK